MPSLWSEQTRFLLCGLALALAWTVRGQTGTDGGEYNLSGPIVGEQSRPQVAVSPSGGYVVWQDNAIDGKNLGIAVRRLDQTLSPAAAKLRVNRSIKGWQENPQVALMRNGAAAIVWQGGAPGAQSIFLRMLKTSGTFTTTKDIPVSRYVKGEQRDPGIVCLTNGNLAVAWSSSFQDGSKQGIYGRVVHRNGKFITNPFRVNQFTANNQRNPSISALSNGNFVVVWASENQGVSAFELLRYTNRVHIYGRIFSSSGSALGSEFRINTRSNVCATPSVAPHGSDGFTVAWAEQSNVRSEGWDIYARHFQLDGVAASEPFAINAVTVGHQHSPKISSVGAQQLVIWTSLTGDGSLDGVFGQFLADGQLSGPTFQVNSTWIQKQFQPAVAGDGRDRFVTAWSSYMGVSGFDVRARRYSVGQQFQLAPAALASGSGQKNSRLSWSEPRSSAATTQRFEVGSSMPDEQNALRVSFQKDQTGGRLQWNTQLGGVYQVQLSTNLGTWMNVGPPRPASGATDSVALGGDHATAIYRVVRVQ